MVGVISRKMKNEEKKIKGFWLRRFFIWEEGGDFDRVQVFYP